MTVVVPLVKAHDHHIPELLRTLAFETDVIEAVVIARSSLKLGRVESYSQWLLGLGSRVGVNVRLESSPKQATAGENRNRGWSAASSEFVAFVDADDLYVSGRLGMMLSVATTFNSNLVLHDFWNSEDEWRSSPADDWSMEDVLHTEQLFSATFPNGRDRDREGITPGDTNVSIPPSNGRSHAATQGHTLVRTSISQLVSFGSRYPGEDGQFCRDVLWEMGRVEFIPSRLSVYRASLSAETRMGYGRRALRKLRRI